MKLLLLSVAFACMGYAQTKSVQKADPDPITDSKVRLELYDLRGQYSELQSKQGELQKKILDSPAAKQMQALQKQIDESALGRELAEVNKQMNDLSAKYLKMVSDQESSHNAKGCQLSANLEWQCPPAASK